MSLLTPLMLAVNTCCAHALQACQSKLQLKSHRALPYYLRSAKAFVRTPTLSAATSQVLCTSVVLVVQGFFSRRPWCLAVIFFCPTLQSSVLWKTQGDAQVHMRPERSRLERRCWPMANVTARWRML